MARKITFLIVLLSLSHFSFGQDVIFTQFLPNPYIINPAYAGYEGRSTFSLTHRRQWMGIEDAPVTTNFTFHIPFLSGLNLGTNITQDQGGVFKSTYGLITAGYSLQLGWYHFLSFGMSFGGGNTSLDFSEGVNINDPALANILESSFFLDGNVGLAYHYHGFNFGITLPTLFKTETYSTLEFDQGEFDALQNYILNADYMFYISEGQHSIQPYILYRSYNGYSPQFEAGAIFHLNHILWIGGAYRDEFGYSGMLGLKIEDYLSIGYSYDYTAYSISGIDQSSHELLITFSTGVKSNWTEQYSTFLSSNQPDRPQREEPPDQEDKPRFQRGQKYD